MSAPTRASMTEAEYLSFERASVEKHEYYQGRVYAMTEAEATHNLIVGNTIIWNILRAKSKGCGSYKKQLNQPKS